MSVNILLARRSVAIVRDTRGYRFIGEWCRKIRAKQERRASPDDSKMLPLYVLLFLPILVTAQGSQSSVTTDRETLRNDASKNAIDWIGENFLKAVNAFYPASRSCGSVEERKKKYKLNKYILPMIVGFMLIKSILLPITLKALAVLSGKAIVLSLMSLILAAIVGLKKVAQKEGDYDKHRRQDTFDFVDEIQDFEPYRLYKERRRKK